MPKIISECCELVKLCDIDCRVRFFLRHCIFITHSCESVQSAKHQSHLSLSYLPGTAGLLFHPAAGGGTGLLTPAPPGSPPGQLLQADHSGLEQVEIQLPT